jgi:hypothetical protein
LGADFEHLNFLRLELLRTREKRMAFQSGVLGVMLANAVTATSEVCTAIKIWTVVGNS